MKTPNFQRYNKIEAVSVSLETLFCVGLFILVLK